MQTTLPPVRGVQFYKDRSFDEPVFDPAKHLRIEQPDSVTLLDFTTISRANTSNNNNEHSQPHPAAPLCRTDVATGHPNEDSSLAFTSAHSILSPEGVEALCKVVARNEDYAQGSQRAPRYLRGLPYMSNFARELSACPALINHVSRLAGQPLVPHYMTASHAHTNISATTAPGAAKKQSVDAWHVYSLSFVLIIVAMMQQGTRGGVLQVVKRRGLAAARAAVEAGLAEQDVLSVGYVRSGFGLVMQGGKLLHRVTGIEEATTPRISVVLSYMPASALHMRDATAIGSWLKGLDNNKDGGFPEAAFEYARGRAHRGAAQLSWFVDRAPFTQDRAALAAALRNTATELEQAARDLETGGRHLGWISDEEHERGEERKRQRAKL
jgi:hypothetical protein